MEFICLPRKKVVASSPPRHHSPSQKNSHAQMLTFTQFQHVLSQSASRSLAKRAPGSEAVNLPHADMFLRMAYTQLGCWADQSQITFANNSHCLFFPNGVPGAGLYHISHKVKCQTQAVKYLNLFFEVVSCVLWKSLVRFGSVQVQHVSPVIMIIFILWHLLENIMFYHTFT